MSPFYDAASRLLPKDVLARLHAFAAKQKPKRAGDVGPVTVELLPYGVVAVKVTARDEYGRTPQYRDRFLVYNIAETWYSDRAAKERIHDWIQDLNGPRRHIKQQIISAVAGLRDGEPETEAMIHFLLDHHLKGELGEYKHTPYPEKFPNGEDPIVGAGLGYVYAVGVHTLRHPKQWTYAVEVRVDTSPSDAGVPCSILAELPATSSADYVKRKAEAIAAQLSKSPSSFDPVLYALSAYSEALKSPAHYNEVDAAERKAEKALAEWAERVPVPGLAPDEIPSYWSYPQDEAFNEVEIDLSLDKDDYPSRGKAKKVKKAPSPKRALIVKWWEISRQIQIIGSYAGTPIVSFTSAVPGDDDLVSEWFKDLKYGLPSDHNGLALARDLEMFHAEIASTAKGARSAQDLHTSIADYTAIQRTIQENITPTTFSLPLVNRKESPLVPVEPYPHLTFPVLQKLFQTCALTSFWGTLEPEKILIDMDIGIVPSVRHEIEEQWRVQSYDGWQEVEWDIRAFSDWLKQYAKAFPGFGVKEGDVDRAIKEMRELLEEERDYAIKTLMEKGQDEVKTALRQAFHDLYIAEGRPHTWPDIRREILTATGWLNPGAAIRLGGRDEIDHEDASGSLTKDQKISLMATLNKEFKREVQEAARQYEAVSGEALDFHDPRVPDTRSGSLFGAKYAPPEVVEASPPALFAPRPKAPEAPPELVASAGMKLVPISKSKETSYNRRKRFTITREGEERRYGDLIQPEVELRQLVPNGDDWQIVVHGGWAGTRTIEHSMGRGTKKDMIAMAQRYLSSLAPGAGGAREHVKRWHGEKVTGWKG